MNTRLSANFTLEEMERSDTAAKLGIRNVAPPAAVRSLALLCTSILEPVRAHFGVPVRINSGYRCLALNDAVGSKPTSQHLAGEAADIELPPHANAEVAAWIRANLKFGQLILENYTQGVPSSGWVHVSLPSPRHHGDVLTMVRRTHGTVYLPGLQA